MIQNPLTAGGRISGGILAARSYTESVHSLEFPRSEFDILLGITLSSSWK